MGGISALRAAERAYLDSGDIHWLAEAEALLDTDLQDAPFTPATRIWLSLLRYDRTGDDQILDAAVAARESKGWHDAAVALPVLTRVWARDGHRADLDRAISHGQRATPAPASEPTAPLWQSPAWRAVDLAGAYLERYRWHSTEADLLLAREISRDASRRATEPAIRVLAQRYLAACEQELYLRRGSRRLLDQAIRRYQRALATVSASALVRPMLATELGTALQDRFAEDGDLADIAEAVALGEQAAEAGDGPDLACHLVNLGTALTANLAHALLSRYQEMGGLDDIDTALRLLGRLRQVRLGRSQRATVAASVARALSMRYEAIGASADLTAAIAAARRGLAGVGAPHATHATRVARLSSLLYYRYLRSGRRRDLDQAISLLRGISEGSASPDQLSQLCAYLGERYDRVGDPADLSAAIGFGQMAREAEYRDFEPSVASTLATVSHGRFQAEGWFDELDEAIERNRLAVAGQHEGTPSYRVMLNNLAVALQDRCNYANDDAALDEAISAHERALALSHPGSPDHPGYLGALASARQLRFERADRPDDLHRAISLHEQALATLGPASPERGDILHNLALARYLKARMTDDAAEYDRAVLLMRSALRRTMSRSVRPQLLLGYARTLAGRQDQLAPSGGSARVLRAFENAVAASERFPVTQIDAADALGAWASKHGLWPHAARAYQTAAQARRALFGTQVQRGHRDAWLARGEEFAAATALAWARSGQPQLAVAALDDGRALELSMAIDERTIAARLRATGRAELAELAERYELAARRLVSPWRVPSVSAMAMMPDSGRRGYLTW